MGTQVIEKSIQAEVNKVLEHIARDCTAGEVLVEELFFVPVTNALWSVFMGKRYDHEDPQIRRIANSLRT